MTEAKNQGIFRPPEATQQFSCDWGALCKFDNYIKTRLREEGIPLTLAEIIEYRALKKKTERSFQALQHVLNRHCI